MRYSGVMIQKWRDFGVPDFVAKWSDFNAARFVQGYSFIPSVGSHCLR
jgi:hypothetical protein